ncbi:hypothetical protein KAX17_10680 [Candidatus Bipolaricaulota bacterium]|nr:hypothetical protein [Candidatus Bipolaricaulota bacterium]
MSNRTYNIIFEIHGYPKGLSDLKTTIKKPLSKYVSRCSIDVKKTAKNWCLCHISGSLDDVDACHMLFNKDCLPDLHVIRTLDEAGDNIRSRAYPILSRAEQQLRAFINRVMTDVAGDDWWNSWSPPGVDEKAVMRKATGANDHQIELVDFTDLLTLMTAQIQDWPDDYKLSAKDIADIIGGNADFEMFKAQLSKRLMKRSAWDDIFLPYITDSASWEEMKDELVSIIIPIRHRVMHHRPTHLYHLEKVKGHSRRLRKHLEHSRRTIDEKQRRELQELSHEMTQTLQRSVARINQELFGSTDWVRSLAQMHEAFRKSMAPFAAMQKQWERQMRPWLEIQERVRKQMEPFRKLQEQWQKGIEKLTKGLR